MAGEEEDVPPSLSCVSSRSLRPLVRSAAAVLHHPAAARDKCGGGHVGTGVRGRGVWVGRVRPLPAAGAVAKATGCIPPSSPRLSARTAAVQPATLLQGVVSAAHRVSPAVSYPNTPLSAAPQHTQTTPTRPSLPSPAPPLSNTHPPHLLSARNNPPTMSITSKPPPTLTNKAKPPTVQSATKNMNGSLLNASKEVSSVIGGLKQVIKEGGLEEEEEEEEDEEEDEGEDGEEAKKTTQRRSSRYDSADSSDSGVGGEWSASSPCSSLTSSPPPRPEEDLDDCCPTPAPTPTADSPHTTPSPTTPHHVHQLTCMAPNDGSGVRMGRKAGHDGDRLMGGFGPGGQVGHTPHKDRPPDTAHLPVRATRRSAPHDAAHRRRRLQAGQVRKRSGEEVSMGAERRIKLARPSPPPSPINGVRRLNGCVNGGVNGEAAALLHRLATLTGAVAGEKASRPNNHALNHTNNGLTKDSLQNGVGRIFGKNGIKCFNGSVNGRVNGGVRPERVNGVRRVVGEELRRKAELHHTNNNIDPTSLLPTTPTKFAHSDAHLPTGGHTPTLAKRSSQGIPRPTQGLTLNCDVGISLPALSPRAAHQPPLSPTAARCSAKSSPPPAHTTKSRSSSASSGAGSSAPSSGTSTPTPIVRFPVPEKKEAADVCRWSECNLTLDPTTSLLEHIQAVHVEGQLEAESFRCLWVGCKVYNKASCSVSWLERHVLTHGGHKPFKCIVDGCGQRFTSQTALGRHVNHHFSVTATTPSPRPPTQPSPSKLIRKNGRKCRFRKKPWSAARMFDMFDVGVMECVRWRLTCVTQIQNGGTTQASGQNFTLRPQVLARRVCSKGMKEVLVRWSPPGVLADEWVEMDQLEATRSVPLEQLSPEAKQAVTQLCYPSLARPQKHRRKRPSCPKSLSLDISKAV